MNNRPFVTVMSIAELHVYKKFLFCILQLGLLLAYYFLDKALVEWRYGRQTNIDEVPGRS